MVALEAWYPGEHVWLVVYASSGIMNVVVDSDSEPVAGLTGRAVRGDDHDEPEVVLVRRFDGTSERP